jgi:hypothetical protein
MYCLVNKEQTSVKSNNIKQNKKGYKNKPIMNEPETKTTLRDAHPNATAAWANDHASMIPVANAAQDPIDNSNHTKPKVLNSKRSQSGAAYVTPTCEPDPVKLLVLMSATEHSQMVEKLVENVTSDTEAKQIITARKTTYSKACHKHKNFNPENQNENVEKRLRKTQAHYECCPFTKTKIATLNLCLGLPGKNKNPNHAIKKISCLQETEIKINFNADLLSFSGFSFEYELNDFMIRAGIYIKSIIK